jgi:hypothetical protein
MNTPDKRLVKLENLLASNEEQPKTETIAELRSVGIDTAQFFSRIKKLVQVGYTDQLRAAAQQQQEKERALPHFLDQLAAMSREAMLAVFAQLQGGAFGTQYQEAALARCRNKDTSLLSDEELRSWLEDIGDILGSSPDEE